MSDKRRKEFSDRAKELCSRWNAQFRAEVGATKLALLNGWLNAIQHSMTYSPGSQLNTMPNRHLQAKGIMDLLMGEQNLGNTDLARETMEFALEYETYDPR